MDLGAARLLLEAVKVSEEWWEVCEEELLKLSVYSSTALCKNLALAAMT